MNRSRVFLWLRISASAVCLIACGLLIALWVRSYTWMDFFQWTFPGGQRFTINSEVGRLSITRRPENKTQMRRGIFSDDIHPQNVSLMQRLYREHEIALGFGTRRDAGGVGFHVPHSFLALLIGALVAAPWIRWRFSLRTLMIAMGVVAAVLGLVVWLSR